MCTSRKVSLGRPKSALLAGGVCPLGRLKSVPRAG